MKKLLKKILNKVFRPVIFVEVAEKEGSNLFKDKVILVTGGGSGLGYYIAKRLLKEGAIVIITGRNKQKLENAKKQLGENCKYKVFDIKDISKMDNLINDIYNKYGKIDCLINNAGISLHEGNILNVSEDNFQDQIDTNLKGGYFLVKSYIKKYNELKQKNGNIIFISSERGKQCDDVPYGLTKVAVNSLVEGLSRRFYKNGIRVNAIAPGITASDMTEINKNDDLYCDYNASQRYFIPEEVAEVVAFIASDLSKCISGEIIHCDAGNHLNPWFK